MLTMRRKLGYGIGDLGISLAYFTVGFFFLFYLTDLVGLPPALAGLAFFIGRLWDSVNDPMIGVWNDRSRSRLGRKRSFLLLGALPFAVTYALLWLIPLGASQEVKFLWAALSMLLYTTVYSLITVPYMALVPVMTKDYDERTQITGIRAILSTLGSILGGGVSLLVSSFASKLVGLQVMAGTFGLLAGGSILIAAQSVKGLEKPEEAPQNQPRYSLRDYGKLLREPNVFILMLFKFLGAVATGALTASLPYFARHILGSERVSTIGLAIYVLVSALCIPIWNRLSRRLDKRRLLLGGAIAATLFLLVIGQVSQVVYFYVGCGFLGAAMASYLLIPYSLVPDLVEYYEHKTGERHESVFFGLWITVHQFGISTAGLLLGVFLQIFGYDGTLETQNPAALSAVRMAFGVLPGFMLVIATLVLQRYTITRQVFQTIKAELSSRAAPSQAD